MNPKIDFAPDNMPVEDYNSDRWARDALSRLDGYDVVDIHWESVVDDRLGDEHGEWTVDIEHQRKRVSVSHPRILSALWAAVNQIDHEMSAEAREQEAKRAAALAKLTPEEQRLLRLSTR